MSPEEIGMQIHKGLRQKVKEAKEHLQEIENFLDYLGDNWPTLPGDSNETT